MSSSEIISIKDFVFLLWNQYCYKSPSEKNRSFSQNDNSLLKFGHESGWLEDQDEVHCNEVLTKRTAARILHQFLKIQLKISDLENISDAEILKDLYTCRVCVNHVAQIFIRKIMDCEEVEVNGQRALIFNMLKPVSRKEADSSILKLFELFH